VRDHWFSRDVLVAALPLHPGEVARERGGIAGEEDESTGEDARVRKDDPDGGEHTKDGVGEQRNYGWQ
jgi:hypothetical protein